MINFVNLFNLFLLLFMSLIALFDSLCPTCNRLAYIGWLIERPAAVDDLGLSPIGLQWTTVGSVGLGTEVNHRIFAGLKLKTTTQAQISEKITRSKQKLKQKAPYQAQI